MMIALNKIFMSGYPISWWMTRTPTTEASHRIVPIVMFFYYMGHSPPSGHAKPSRLTIEAAGVRAFPIHRVLSCPIHSPWPCSALFWSRTEGRVIWIHFLLISHFNPEYIDINSDRNELSTMLSSSPGGIYLFPWIEYSHPPPVKQHSEDPYRIPGART